MGTSTQHYSEKRTGSSEVKLVLLKPQPTNLQTQPHCMQKYSWVFAAPHMQMIFSFYVGDY